MALPRLALVLVVASACSSDSSSGGPIPLEQLQQTYVSYLCNTAARCGIIDSVATCRTLRFATGTQGNNLFTPGEIEAAMAGRMSYDGAAAGQCLGAYFSTCMQGYVGTDRARISACDTMFQPLGDAMSACGFSGECISNVCQLTSTCTGSCLGGTAPPAKPRTGESCAMTQSCVESFCDPQTQVCTAYLVQGDSCTANSQCDAGLSCRTGTCQPLAATGDPCGSTSDCALIGDYCAGTCTHYALLGAACTSNTQCGSSYFCDTTTMTCALRPTIGTMCTTMACIDQSYCDSMTSMCVALVADGGSCMSSQECQSNLCQFTTSSTGTCASQMVCY